MYLVQLVQLLGSLYTSSCHGYQFSPSSVSKYHISLSMDHTSVCNSHHIFILMRWYYMDQRMLYACLLVVKLLDKRVTVLKYLLFSAFTLMNCWLWIGGGVWPGLESLWYLLTFTKCCMILSHDYKQAWLDMTESPGLLLVPINVCHLWLLCLFAFASAVAYLYRSWWCCSECSHILWSIPQELIDLIYYIVIHPRVSVTKYLSQLDIYT